MQDVFGDQDYILQLPDEILMMTLSYLPDWFKCILAFVCKRLHSLLTDYQCIPYGLVMGCVLVDDGKLLNWAIDKGAPIHPDCIRFAVTTQHTHMLPAMLPYFNYGINTGMPNEGMGRLTRHFTATAAMMGDLDTLVLMRKHNAVIDRITACAAAYAGHEEIVKYCLTRGVCLDMQMVLCAAAGGRADVMIWLLRKAFANVGPKNRSAHTSSTSTRSTRNSPFIRKV